MADGRQAGSDLVILGGGMAAVAAAFRLTDPDREERFRSVTIYQQGWRLGGKGASGRTTEMRIQEHGLHIWFGHYENSFRLLRDCHASLDELARREPERFKRWSTILTDVADGFVPVSRVTVMEDESGTWRPWTASFPMDDRSPWDRDVVTEPADWDVPNYLEQLVERGLGVLSELLASVGTSSGLTIEVDTEPADLDDRLAELTRDAGALVQRGHAILGAIGNVAGLLFGRLQTHGGPIADPETWDQLELVARSSRRLFEAVWLRLDDDYLSNDAIRRLITIADLGLAVLDGLLRHRISEDNELDILDQWDLREWLRMNGAASATVNSSFVRCLAYDLPFAYVQGDRRRADWAAGTAVRLLFRTFFSYRGALMWKMTAGMGDVVFAPLYEALVKRGVNIRFFHQVARLELSDSDGRPVVRRIWFTTQADRSAGARPLQHPSGPMDVDDARARLVPWPRDASSDEAQLMCWPSVPADPDLAFAERWDGPSRANAYLDIGPEDVVLFGLPVGMVPEVAPDLLTVSGWREMVDALQTVATVGYQVWLTDPAPVALGFPSDTTACGFSEPFDTFSDMPQLRHREGSDAAWAVYLCSVLDERARVDDHRSRRPHREFVLPVTRSRIAAGNPSVAPITPEQRPLWLDRGRAVALAQQMVAQFWDERAAVLWPNGSLGSAGDGLDRPPHCQRCGGAHDSRVVSCFLTANIDPSERYVLSVSKSSKYRIDPGRTGVANLVIAGDWTRCGLNVGCIEAATVSGILAAEAILGQELEVIGRQHVTLPAY